MPETMFHTTFSTSHFWLSRAKNGSESGLRSAVFYRFGFNHAMAWQVPKENDNEVKGTGNSVDFGARIYDSRLGRWMSVDPLFKDYTDLTPYCFSANSAIWLYDSDGRKIIINYLDEKGCPQTYEYDSGLTPPDNEFVKETLNAIQQLSNTAQGCELVSLVSESEFSIDINETTDEYGDRFIPSDKYNSGLTMPKLGETQSGSGGTIYWNPQSTASGEDINGSTYCPSFISLGHEFVHGVQSFLAEYNTLPSDISPELFQREYVACHFENILRVENGVALRVFYFQNGNGPQLINCDGTQNGTDFDYNEDETNTEDGKII